MLGLLIVRDRNIFFIFRTIGIALAFTVVGSFFMGYLHIKLIPQNYLIFLAAITCAVFLLDCFRRKKIFSFWDEIKKFNFEKRTVILATLFFIVPVLACLLYFESNLGIPRYISIDSAYHFMLGRYINESHQLLFFSRDLYFQDPVNYPFGTSVITSLTSSLFSFFAYGQFYNLLNIFFFALVTTYFFSVAYRKIPIRTKTGLFLFLILNCFGFFFNLMSMGFFSQLVGLFFLILFVDFYPEIKNSAWGSVLSGVLLSVLFFTYIYWLPIALLFILFQNIDFKNIKKSIYNKRNILNILIFAGVFLAISMPYIIALINFRFLRFASDNGGAYKTFFLNFVIMAPFIMVGLSSMIKNWLEENNPVATFFISSFLFSLILYILYEFDIASEYTLAKSYYLIGPIFYYMSIVGMEGAFFNMKNKTFASAKITISDKSVFWEIKNKTLNYVFMVTYLSIIFLVILVPFEKMDRNFEVVKSPSLKMNTWKLNGRIFDVFYFNSQVINTDNLRTNRAKLTKNWDFLNKVEHYMPQQEDLEKVMVIANADYSFWFYSMTWIWPRTPINNSESIWKKLPTYSTWLSQRQSDTLVLLDTPETNTWITDNNFDFSNFNIMYKVGENYVLQLKKSS